MLIFQQSGFAQVASVELNITGCLAALHNSFVADKFRPLHLRYLQYLPTNNSFKLYLDKGDIAFSSQPSAISRRGHFPSGLSRNSLKESVPWDEAKFQAESQTLLKYFFIGLALPNSSFWVNLRPDAEDKIIDEYLSKTDVGRIMLAADLQLKKDTAQMTSPATPEGREYWDKLYKKASDLYGYDNVTIPTLTRPWIVPDEIIIRETTSSSPSAYIYKATLKVMLEQDYLQNSTTYNFQDTRSKALNEYSSQLIRELIIPKLTKAVNSSKRYAPLRQAYYSLILAQWFKARFKQPSSLRTTVGGEAISARINSRNLTNLISKEAWSKTTYFQAYQKSFKDGEYNIQEPVYTPTGQTIRSYFSGGENFAINIQPFGTVNAGSSPVSIVVASSPAVTHVNDIAVTIQGTGFSISPGLVVSESHQKAERVESSNSSVNESKDNYFSLSDKEKDEFRTQYWDKLGNEGYVTSTWEALQNLTIASQRLSTSVHPDDSVVSFGQSPAWIVKTMQAMDSNPNRFIYLAFSGNWYEQVEARSIFEQPSFIKKTDEPDSAQKEAYRQYLKTLKLDPESIAAREGKTVIVEYKIGGRSLKSFLSLLSEWAEELKTDIRGKVELRLFVEDINGNIMFAPGEAAFGFPIKYSEVDVTLIRQLSESDQYKDRIVAYYPYQKWTEVDPQKFIISENAQLAHFRILDFLTSHYPGLVKTADLIVAASSPAETGAKKTLPITIVTIEEWHKNCLLEIPDSADINLELRGRYDGDYVNHPDGLPATRRFYENHPEFLGYRIEDERVLISGVGEFPSVSEIPKAMTNYITWFNIQLSGILNKNKPREKEVLQFAAEAHIRFARIHPFRDGNGRTAEYITNYILNIFGYLEVKNLRIENIHYKDRQINKRYSDAMQDGDIKALVRLIQEAQAANQGGSGGIDSSVIRSGSSRQTSSPLMPQELSPGGIDFRALPIVTQAMSNLRLSASSSLSLSQLNSINPNKELQEIQKMVEAGIIPSTDRIKEYVQASCLKGNPDVQKVVSCIADILRIEEERYSPTNPTLKDILVVLDSANSVQQLKAVFIGTVP